MIDSKNLAQDIWAQLQRASVDKHHEWRSPVLVTNGQTGWPDARTVILRSVNLSAKQLVFYTDSRSPKVAQLHAIPNAMIVFWSKRLNWQLRVKATVAIKIDDAETDNIWQKVKQSPSAGDYLSALAPGELLTETATTTNNQAHFAVLIATVIEMDWLALSRDGHQRARIVDSKVSFLQP